MPKYKKGPICNFGVKNGAAIFFDFSRLKSTFVKEIDFSRLKSNCVKKVDFSRLKSTFVERNCPQPTKIKLVESNTLTREMYKLHRLIQLSEKPEYESQQKSGFGSLPESRSK